MYAVSRLNNINNPKYSCQLFCCIFARIYLQITKVYFKIDQQQNVLSYVITQALNSKLKYKNKSVFIISDSIFKPRINMSILNDFVGRYEYYIKKNFSE